ncbi:methylcobalamin:coenzyme M methyltransferase [Oxobacter pfennigii]|uniref:Methylcobalamin:coenzyme M methyltransferase n=1 Tax=Oxobacter pfennigii TaxID=36849 RepID=A0A0P8WAD3_9CLOT|nr:uroporphyrinogen decarboxylase family protein [Oxobacter pfennigii]KPU45579.1 methylcobalamin:coenzyme M methyltransferase [Oxobacter pfennigii]
MSKSKLTPKENYLKVVRGEIPDWVPIHTMGLPGYNGETAWKMVGPNIWGTPGAPSKDGRTDIWGVHYVANEETNYGGIPEPNNFILEDVTKWHEVVKAPETPAVDEIDWDAQMKKDYEFSNIDTTQSAAMMNIPLMPFQQLIALMGFNNGLCALLEEPESCKELINFMIDYYMPFIEKAVDVYKPDMVYILDDTAAKLNPFISLDIFQDIFVPAYARLLKPANDRGIPIQLHNCGRCEDFLDDMVKLGVRAWDPAQTANNLLSIKEKFKGKLTVCGCYDWKVPLTWPEYNEEELRQSVRDAIDKYAPGGGYAARANALGKFGDPDIAKVNEILQSEVYYYTRDYYIK